MAIRDYQSLMLPTLMALAGGTEVPLSDIRRRVADAENLTAEEVSEKLPSGRQTILANRVSWALLGMVRAGLVERVRHGVYRLSDEGERLLASEPTRVDDGLLGTYPAFVQWKNEVKQRAAAIQRPEGRELESKETPEDSIERAAGELRAVLESEVLERVRGATPAFLEQVVVDLLVSMGYGGGNAEMGRVTGGAGDGGIDGTIREDALGLDEIYVQAKKYSGDNLVGAGDLRNFAGAIDATGATKGVFVTTNGFRRSAKTYVERSPKRIVLIDGRELARLMVQHDIGVRTRVQHEIKRIDEDYFGQEVL